MTHNKLVIFVITLFLLVPVLVPAQPTDIATVLLLPVLGGTQGDNITLGNLIASLRDINNACKLLDESENTVLLPANFSGFSSEDNALLFRLGVQYQANFIIHSYVQKYGERNLAIISRYNVYRKMTDSVYYLEYLDPVEAWIKLPGVISAVMYPATERKEKDYLSTFFSTATSADHYLWVRYRDGVDRVLTQRMMNVFLGDYTETTGKSIMDITADIEDAMELRQGVERYTAFAGYSQKTWRTEIPNMDWKAYMNTYINDLRAGTYKIHSLWGGFPGEAPENDAMKALFIDTGLLKQEFLNLMIIEASRQGNKTRFQLLGADFAYSIDFADMRDFVRQVRGMSLSIANKKATAGYDLSVVQGVKYNYWKYANENIAIPDILTFSQPYHNKPELSIEERSSSSITIESIEFTKTLNPTVLFYYSTENDFSKATPINAKRLKGFKSIAKGEMSISHTITGLKPDTGYYIWAVNCWGNLPWLQSEPVLFNVRTGSK
jgi:hypothetical protein